MILPIGNRLLVKQFKKEVSGVIELTEEDETLLPKGEIIVCIEMDPLIKGDIIFFNELAGERIKDGDEEYLVLKYEDVIAKIC